ncbi:MAG: hypothetical protein K2M17_05925 [Bacilli bacterium]|nr:hypothetical protein [Bacilli bacterium]
MKKKTRLEKAWGRNWKLWMCKGVYICGGLDIKHMPTPKQVYKMLKKEEV